MTKSSVDKNFYTILGLPLSTISNVEFSRDGLKSAYHRALLVHHPDKALKGGMSRSDLSDNIKKDADYSIDEIMLAYQTLSDPGLRREYDEQWMKAAKVTQSITSSDKVRGSHLGVEKFDLDDLDYDDGHGTWSKHCRCGNDKGYVVSEAELINEVSTGEIYVGCRGCSLFIKVLFAAVEEESESAST